jgi:predicted TIM-barrel fold metal-dependent hydrolase
VGGALIVQPINHKFDHSYVIAALQKFPNRLKGMLLYDPSSQSVELALRQLQDLLSQGFVAVRFNPSLWPAGLCMSDNPSLAVYKRCGELGVPVGIMCFNGLHLHFEDICKLIQVSPSTPLIIDHFGFTRLQTNNDKNKNDIDDDDEKDHNFTKLLSLSKYPNVYIKIAALFRLGDTYPYEAVKVQRFIPLLREFGPQRLIFGTDFPYCLEAEGEYCGAVDTVLQWTSEYGSDAQRLIMGENSERLFGKWEDCRK